MTTIIETVDLTKSYRKAVALDGVTVRLERDRIYGLLGRNGAGKTTLMSILTAQNFPTTGSVRVLGEDPYENDRVLRQICFVRESQKYPDDATPRHAFHMANLAFANWDSEFAAQLAAEFDLPLDRTIKKLSRGQLSAVGVIIGLASRAEITFFDEPYLGLDAVARQLFYDRLLEDYAQQPRTIVLSSHLIDEVADLLEHVILIDRGRIMLDEPTDDLRGRAATLTGPTTAVEAAIERRGLGEQVLHRHSLGNVTAASVLHRFTDSEVAELQAADIQLSPVSLQDLVVRLTINAHDADSGAVSPLTSEVSR